MNGAEFVSWVADLSWDNQIRLFLLVVAPAMIWLVGFGGNQKSYE